MHFTHLHISCLTPPIAKMKFHKSYAGKKEVGPTYGFAASREVGPGATVDTLQTRYPRIQASSQDKERDMQPRFTTYPATLGPASHARWAPRRPHV
jgi:hypothetical protein